MVSQADAAHLLRRVGFGPTQAEIDAVAAEPTREAAVDKVLNVAGAPGVSKPGAIDGDNNYEAWVAAVEWWMQRMVTTPVPIIEKMTLFWHGHFATSRDKVGDMSLMWDQQQLFRTGGLGNFRDLVWNVSKGSAMLIYLDNESNEVGAEQENFGRELMELFTCGIGNYTEADVVSMARAWTGHNTVGYVKVNGSYVYDPTYVFNASLHDEGQKTLFGITKNWNAEPTIDELCTGVRAVPTSQFIARKMFQFFAHTSPSGAVVTELGTAFRNAGLDIKALLRAILVHDEFWGPTARYALVKSPVEYMVDLLKRTGVPAGNAGVSWQMSRMGQVLFEPPDVSGWKQNNYWVSTATMWGRGDFVSHLQWKARDLGFLSSLADADAAGAVQTLFTALGIPEPSPATRSRLESWFTTAKSKHKWSIPTDALVLGAMSPDFQVV